MKPNITFTATQATYPPKPHKAELIEQLNGLLDRYNAIYEIYSKTQYVPDHTKQRLEKVLDNVEKAIESVCFWLTHEVITVE